jgi:ADP-ribose pyrophosphatase YjhB (NUDIX family)
MMRKMVRIDADPNLFNYRIAGLALRDGHLLVHRATHEPFWTLPGGRAEIGEDSRETLRREMVEELEQEAEICNLLWVVENFFFFDNRRYHELGFYYRMAVPESFPFASGEIVHRIADGGSDLEFKWVPANEESLAALPLQPNFIPGRIANLPIVTEHLVWHETVPEG